MAIPQNPLDKYSSYTYYFELHAHYNGEVLAELGTQRTAKTTTRFEPNDTLVINGFKDVHQVIEEVEFNSMTPAVTKTEIPSTAATITMMILEPGGFSFIEKIERLRIQNNVQVLDSLFFLLRIFFVGRKPDNEVVTEYAGSVSMALTNFTGSFTERGGQYNLEFLDSGSLGVTTNPQAVGAQLNYAFTNRSISFEATTVQEAYAKFEQKLNETYEYDYNRYLDSRGVRKMKWKITADPEVKGSIATMNSNFFFEGDAKKINMSPRKQIAANLINIVKHSPELMKRIGESKDKLNAEFHKDVFVPYIESRVIPSENEVTVHYHIGIYRGGVEEKSKFIFEFYFAQPGKNVDVMSYDVKFNMINGWLGNGTTLSSIDKHLNISGQRPSKDATHFSSNIVTPDKTVQNMGSVVPDRMPIDDTDKKDIAFRHNAMSGQVSGYNNVTASAMPFMLFGQEAMANYAGTVSPNPVFEIRGHLDILKACFVSQTLDGFAHTFAEQFLWVKINVYMPDGNGGQRQFFYTGYYQVISVSNVFKDGKFIQILSLLIKTT